LREQKLFELPVTTISQLDFNDGNISISDFRDINYDLGKRSPFLLIDFGENKPYPASGGGGQTSKQEEPKTKRGLRWLRNWNRSEMEPKIKNNIIVNRRYPITGEKWGAKSFNSPRER